MLKVGRLAVVIALLCMAGCGGISAGHYVDDPGATSRPASETLFTKAIAPGKTIVVTRTSFDAKLLAGLATPVGDEGTTTASIRVELRVGNAPPVLLGSAIQMDHPDFQTGLDILDVYLANEEVVVVCTSSDVVYLWRILLDHQSYLPDGWTGVISPARIAAHIPFDRDTVSVSLSLQEASPWKQQWKVTLIDKRSDDAVKTEFEQVTDRWKFISVTDATKERPVRLIKIPPVMRDINLVSHLGPMNPVLDEERFQKLMANAKPLAPNDPSIRQWDEFIWYDGTFTSDDGPYNFWLQWNGGGKLLTPDGTMGFFSFSRMGIGDASTTRPARTTRPATPLGPAK